MRANPLQQIDPKTYSATGRCRARSCSVEYRFFLTLNEFERYSRAPGKLVRSVTLNRIAKCSDTFHVFSKSRLMIHFRFSVITFLEKNLSMSHELWSIQDKISAFSVTTLPPFSYPTNPPVTTTVPTVPTVPSTISTFPPITTPPTTVTMPPVTYTTAPTTFTVSRLPYSSHTQGD